MRLKELPVWEKPREKMLREGVSKLSNAEILAILLRTGSDTRSAMDLAGEILSMDSTGIRFLTEASPEELRRIDGMGDAKICSLLAAVELGKRLADPREVMKVICDFYKIPCPAELPPEVWRNSGKTVSDNVVDLLDFM